MGFQHALYFSAKDRFPRELDDRSEYTPEEIEKRIAWTEARRLRNMSPRTDCLLHVYMTNLQKTSTQRSNTALKLVQRMERKMKCDETYVMVPDKDEMEMLDKSRDLMRLRLLRRYGEALAKKFELSKAQVEKKAGHCTECVEILWGYWTVVHDGIAKDRRLQDKMKSQGTVTLFRETPTIRAVTRVAKGLLIDENELLVTVQDFVEKGPKSRADLDQVIALRKPHTLADTIFADLQFLDASQVFDQTEANRYRDVIFAFRDKYFAFRSDCEDKPGLWQYTDQYRKESKAMLRTAT